MKTKAFTMAEVLVTIGIIGVVAAMTIPSLMKKYRAFVLQQQFKKVYSALSVAIQKVQFDMGENVKCFYGVTQEWGDCPLFYNELAKRLNVIQTCKGNALEKGCLPKESYKPLEKLYAEGKPDMEQDEAENAFRAQCNGFSSNVIEKENNVYVLNGGFLFMTYFAREIAPIFMVDINGKNRPNKWGYDLFVFRLVKRKRSDSSFVMEPTYTCSFAEEGGYTSPQYINIINGRPINYVDY